MYIYIYIIYNIYIYIKYNIFSTFWMPRAAPERERGTVPELRKGEGSRARGATAAVGDSTACRAALRWAARPPNRRGTVPRYDLILCVERADVSVTVSLLR